MCAIASRSRRVCPPLAALVLAAASSVAAQPPAADAARVPLATLVAEALRVSPEVAAAAYRRDAARQRPLQERVLPDPMVSIGYTAVGNPLPGAGLGREPTANIGVMVSQALPSAGTRRLRASIATREADAEEQLVAAARLEVRARVEAVYYRLAYAHAAADVLARNRELLDTLASVGESRYAVGEAAQQDVFRAQAQLSVLELQQERMQQERRAREGELNALLARPAGTPVGRPDDLALTPFDLLLADLSAAATAHAPLLGRDRILVERSRLAVDAARRANRPDLALSGGYAYTGSMRPMYELRLDVTLPLRRAGRDAAVAERLAGLGESRQALESTRLSLQGRLDVELQTAATSRRLAGLYQDTVLPQARLALESSIASYQAGAVDFLSVLTNFGTVLEYELTYFDTLADHHTAVSRLRAMSGAPIAQ